MTMADYVGADYVGADDDLQDLLNAVSGDYDDDEEVGAARKRKTNIKLKLAKLASAGRMPAIFLGFDTTIAASTSTASTSEGNVRLRPTDLIVKPENAGDWQLTSLRIGRVDLMSGATGIPASAFTGSMQRPPISAPVLEAGTLSSIQASNLTLASSRFQAMFTALDISKNPVSP
jgi:hypothetical protein